MDKEGLELKNKLAVFAALCAMAALTTASAEVIASCRAALKLCSELIIPSLFPFFVLSGLLGRLGFPGYLGALLSPMAARLFGVSGAGVSALFVGLTGGYPTGAVYIAQLRRDGVISAGEAGKLLAFCNNSGPAFIIGAVGAGVFGSARAGLLLYLAHIAAAVATGLLLRGEKTAAAPGRPAPPPEPPPFSRALTESVRQAVISVLNVCGFVVCFTVFAGLLDANGFFPARSGALAELCGAELHFTRALLTGFLELGSGAAALRSLAATPANLALAAWLLGWGGISVHFQTMSAIADTEIKGALHFAGRLVSACIAAALVYAAGGSLK